MTKQEAFSSLTFKPVEWGLIEDDHMNIFDDENKPMHLLLARPGVILKTKDGKFLLVGDCNAELGVCSCCTDIEWGNIVAYAEIWDEAR